MTSRTERIKEALGRHGFAFYDSHTRFRKKPYLAVFKRNPECYHRTFMNPTFSNGIDYDEDNVLERVLKFFLADKSLTGARIKDLGPRRIQSDSFRWALEDGKDPDQHIADWWRKVFIEGEQ